MEKARVVSRINLDTGTKIVGQISPDDLYTDQEIRQKKKRAEEARRLQEFYDWTLGVAIERPFIKTQWKVRTQQLHSDFRKKNGVPPTRKQKKALRRQAAIEIAQRYKDTRF